MSETQRSARHRSREAALQALYAADLGAARGAPRASTEAVDELALHFELPAGAQAFAKELVDGVGQHREALDTALAEAARNWRIERMAIVDRNVLRLGAYELLVAGTARAVVIDEAVELARRYGDDRSPRFVNGVLDALASKAAEHAGS